MRRGRIVDMGVAVVVPVRMHMVVTMGMTMRMVVRMGVGCGGNHGQDVIL